MTRGHKQTLETRRKISEAKFKGGLPYCVCGKRLSSYRSIYCKPCFGDKRRGVFVKPVVKYYAIHRWIRTIYGSANMCEEPTCLGDSTFYEWALVHGKSYERERDNFKQLCKKCHNLYDNVYANRKRNKRGLFV